MFAPTTQVPVGTIYLYFYTDGSCVEWGWKVKITGEVSVVKLTLTWSLELQKNLSVLVGRAACGLLVGTETDAEEKGVVKYLNSNLLRGGLEDLVPSDATEVPLLPVPDQGGDDDLAVIGAVSLDEAELVYALADEAYESSSPSTRALVDALLGELRSAGIGPKVRSTCWRVGMYVCTYVRVCAGVCLRGCVCAGVMRSRVRADLCNTIPSPPRWYSTFCTAAQVPGKPRPLDAQVEAATFGALIKHNALLAEAYTAAEACAAGGDDDGASSSAASGKGLPSLSLSLEKLTPNLKACWELVMELRRWIFYESRTRNERADEAGGEHTVAGSVLSKARLLCRFVPLSATPDLPDPTPSAAAAAAANPRKTAKSRWAKVSRTSIRRSVCVRARVCLCEKAHLGCSSPHTKTQGSLSLPPPPSLFSLPPSPPVQFLPRGGSNNPFPSFLRRSGWRSTCTAPGSGSGRRSAPGPRRRRRPCRRT